MKLPGQHIGVMFSELWDRLLGRNTTLAARHVVNQVRGWWMTRMVRWGP